MAIGIILLLILLIITINGNFTKRKVVKLVTKRKVIKLELKEQFIIPEENKRTYMQNLFPTINIPKHKYPILINKLNSLRYVMGIREEKVREQLKPILLDLLIPNYYAIRFTNPKSYKQLSLEKSDYAYIFREDNILDSRAEAEKYFEKCKHYQLTQLMIGSKEKKMDYEIQLLYVETKNGILINETVEKRLNEWSLSF